MANQGDKRHVNFDNSDAELDAREWVLRTLESYQREAEQWLAQHHANMRSALRQGSVSPHLAPEVPRLDVLDEARSQAVQLALSPFNETRTAAAVSATMLPVLPGVVFTEIANSPSEGDLTKMHSSFAIDQRKHYRRPKSRFLQVMTDSEAVINSPASAAEGSLRARLDRMVQGYFDMVIGAIIILNAIVMFVELEVQGRNTRPAGGTIEPHWIFVVLRHTFNVIFTLELGLKLYIDRWWFFLSFFNSMDAGVVLVTLADAYILTWMNTELFNVSVFRLVRFARLVRVLRVIRTLNLFRQLRILLNTIAMSFMSLFWSMVVLFVFMLASSLLLCQMLQDYVSNGDNPDAQEWVQHYYGTSSRSLYTIFELTFSGCWPNYARTLIDQVSAGYAVFFVLYVAGVIFAMVRIISALFLKDTLQAASNDADIIVGEKIKEIKSFVAKLSDLFHEADTHDNGFLTMDDFMKVLEYPKVRLWMSVVGLDVSDATAIFEILDDGDGRVSQEEFINGVMRLKGYARSQDAVLIMRDTDRIMRACRATRDACETLNCALRGEDSKARQQVLSADRRRKLLVSC